MSDGFATSVKAWVADNLPEALKGVDIGMYGPSSPEPEIQEAFELWRRRLAEQGWGAPTWPEEYGGAGLAGAEAKIIAREIHAAGSMNPIPFLAGMGGNNGWPHAYGIWNGGTKKAPSSRHGQRGRALVPRAFRAERGVRSRLAGDPRRAEGRSLDSQWSENLDIRSRQKPVVRRPGADRPRRGQA